MSSDILSIHGLTVRMEIDVVRKDVELSFLSIMFGVCLLFGFFSSEFLPRKVFIRGFFPWVCRPHVINKSQFFSWLTPLIVLYSCSCVFFFLTWVEVVFDVWFYVAVGCFTCFFLAVHCLSFPKLYNYVKC